MRNIVVSRLSIIPALVFAFMLASNAFGQDREARSYQDGYGARSTMGQDPDEILEYGHNMMRYGFYETGMQGGSNKYPGYNRDLSDETTRKLNHEQEAFIKATEGLRHSIYEKELYLKAELANEDPDTDIALSFQKDISEAKGKFEQKMIEHLIRMKKINMEALKK
jgi:hypothetical protein